MFFHRHAAQCHHAVYMRVDRYHLVRAVEILDQELISQFFCRVAFYISLICRITNVHFCYLLHFTVVLSCIQFYEVVYKLLCLYTD